MALLAGPRTCRRGFESWPGTTGVVALGSDGFLAGKVTAGLAESDGSLSVGL